METQIINENTAQKGGLLHPKLSVPSLGKQYFVNISEIVRLEAAGNYCSIHLNSGNSLMTCKHLGLYEKILVKLGFSRVHNSHLINLDYITEYSSDGYLTLGNHANIPVSVRRKGNLIQCLAIVV